MHSSELSSLPPSGIQSVPLLALLALVFVVAIIVVFVTGIIRLIRPHSSFPGAGVFRVVAFTIVTLTVSLGLLTVLSPREAGTATSESEPSQLVVQPFEGDSFVLRELDAGIQIGTAPSSETHAEDTPSLNQSPLWIPITRATLSKLGNAENAAEIQRLAEQIPPELTHAYELIPLTPAGSISTPPGFRHVLSPAAIRFMLTPRNLQTITRALAAFLPAEAESAEDTTGEVADLETPPVDDWVRQTPGIGQAVVISKFTEATISPQNALRPVIVEALEKRITKLCSREFGIGDGWQKLVDVSLSDAAVEQCILKTDKKTEVLNTVDGSKMMQQTYALIEFPEDIERQVLGNVKTALIRSRTAAVCITLIAVWLCGLLLAFTFHASENGSLLRKLATVPTMAVLILPCLLLAIAMISAMASGETFELTWGKGRVACVIDRNSDYNVSR